jgi:hypothetical protein
MSSVLPPVPWDKPQTSYEWVDWYTKLRDVIDNSQLDHNQLQNLQGGNSTERYHLTAAQVASLDSLSVGFYEEGTWTPTVTSQTGSITSYSATGYYTKIGRHVHATFEVLFTSAGTAGGGAVVTLPVAAGMFPVVGCGRETVNTGSALVCDTGPGAPTLVTVRTYNNGSPIATNSYIMVSVSYAV